MATPVAAPPADVVAGDVARALAEDLGSGDATAQLLPDDQDQAYVIAKEAGVIAGRPWFDACFLALDPNARLGWRVGEGQAVAAGTVLVTIAGRSRALVSAERPALNFLQTLSATASRTAECVAAVAGSRTRVLDTRKTLPGLRLAQKYAVRAGGGVNHRMGLFDAVMLKENHIHAAGSIAAAVAESRSRHPDIPVIVEVETLAGRVGYGPVTLRDVAGLLDGGLADGAPHSLSLGLVDEMEWLASQQRVTFARVGVIDPLDLDDYRAHGGLRGLDGRAVQRAR